MRNTLAALDKTGCTTGLPIVTYSFEFKLNDGTTFQLIEADGDVPVTGVNVLPTTSNIAAGGSTTFAVTVNPADADNKQFTVSLSVPARATVAFAGNTVTVTMLR